MEYRRSRKRKEELRRSLNKEVTLGHEAGLLEAEHEYERTHKVSQREIASEIALASSRNVWRREGASTRISTTENGRHAVACCDDHVVLLDLLKQTETRLDEVGKDATFLQNETMVAVAQKRYVYVYDQSGTEIHRMNSTKEPEHLSFLRYHFLLAVVGRAGYLKYHDVSIGAQCSQHKAKRALALFRNPQTATLSLCHSNGVVSFWSPAQPQALAKVLCHRASVSAGACAFDGTYFATASRDEGTVKCWDLRQFGLPLHTLRKSATDVAFSQRGMLAACHGAGVDIFEDGKTAKLFRPYLSHRSSDRVTSTLFRPYEDSLFLCSASSLDSIAVPGSGEPNYDALEDDPYRSSKARKAILISGLLDKLPPETIGLERGGPVVGAVARDPAELERANLDAAEKANRDPTNRREKKKTRGRSKLAAKLRKKAKNVVSLETEKLRAKLQEERLRKKKKQNGTGKNNDATSPVAEKESALSRLFLTT